MIENRISSFLSDLKLKGLYRSRTVFPAQLVNFCSNDYLSLAENPEIKKAYQLGIEIFGTGSGGSIAVCGYHSAHQSLEQLCTELLDVDDALLFSSGYAANLALISLAAKWKAQLFIDKYCPCFFL